MDATALFLLGVLLGGAGIYASRVGKRAHGARPDARAREHRYASITPVSALLGDETREVRPFTDVHFAALSAELLDDVRTQHGALAAAIWGFRDGLLTLDLIAGDRALVSASEQTLEPLLAWSAREGVAQLGPDGDAPVAAVAPVGVRGGPRAGSIALLFDRPFTGDRANLKHWMLRHGRRIGLVAELVRPRAACSSP